MSRNDETILQLKETIANKRAAIGPKKRFSPKTSCSLELDGQRYNLHAASTEQLVFLVCKLYAIETAWETLKQTEDSLPGTVMISGFDVRDWIEDIRAKLAVIDQKTKEAQLAVLESKLDALLSPDKQTELEIDKIAALLKGAADI